MKDLIRALQSAITLSHARVRACACAFALTFLLAACDGAIVQQGDYADVGTRSIIKRHGQQLVAEITAINGPLITTDFHLHGELMASRNYYRGLYPVSGTENGYQFELDFDQGILERLFPMKVGNEVSFNGSLQIIDRGMAIDAWVHMSVIEKKTIDLSSGSHQVFVVDVITEYRKDGDVQRNSNVLYYDAVMGLLLKSVVQENGQQSFWRVVSIEKPGETSRGQNQNRQQIRSGTVMI